MNVIIIEDEKPAAGKLQKALLACNMQISVLAVLGSVSATVNWLQHHSPPELAFMDVELSDGLSFEIFKQVPVNFPIIFITAYDEYWQKGFEYNSIDYLLKPVKQEKLLVSLRKYENLKKHFVSGFQQLLEWNSNTPAVALKKRFLIKKGSDYITVKTESVAYFYATLKTVFLVDDKGQKFMMENSLSDLQKDVDPAQFYRLNRKYLANLNAIKTIKSFGKSKLVIELIPQTTEEVIVSQENVSAFKDWIGQ